MYMRTVTEPRGTLPSVCAPAGLRRPCAHTSDSRIPIRHHLSNPQKSSIPLQTTPRRCIGTIDSQFRRGPPTISPSGLAPTPPFVGRRRRGKPRTSPHTTSATTCHNCRLACTCTCTSILRVLRAPRSFSAAHRYPHYAYAISEQHRSQAPTFSV